MNVKYNKIFYICFSSFFLVILLTGYCFLELVVERFPQLFSDSSALYFYSALFQANAAIISIIGIFFIFRIQAHQSSIDLIRNGLLADNGRRSWPAEIIEWDSYALEEKENLLKEEKTHKNGSNNKSISNQLSSWTVKERNLATVKKTIVTPIVFIATVMILEIFSLFSATYIHHFGLLSELFLMYTNLVLEFSIIIMVLYHLMINIKTSAV